MAFDVFALHGGHVTALTVTGLTPVGGAKSSGVMLSGLLQSGDYAILAPEDKGLAVHSLVGKARQPQRLGPNESLAIADLTLVLLPKVDATTSDNSPDFLPIQNILSQMAEPKNTERPLRAVLKEVMAIAQHEKGLVISRGVGSEYEVLVGENVDPADNWLSESLIQSVLRDKKPAFVHNLIGSHYHASQSLVATGFLSIFCWPLIVQGEPSGVLLTGSRRPHAGLSAKNIPHIDTYVQLAALIGNLRRRELALNREIEQLRTRNEDNPFQTQNARLRATCQLAAQVADSDLAILIQGETGVGKEVMARWIHERSARRKGPFIAVNCGAIPSELLESLLFGHKKGAFTHALSDQPGKLQQAHGGTLLLDEVGDLPAALQVKLLRVLNDKMVEPLGSNRPQEVDVRLISATHHPLKEMLAQKTFREDLYYRLAEMTLWIPPLRERPADILLIAHQWLASMGTGKTLSDDARQWLLAQSWKGNVRELKSVLKRASVLATGNEIQRQHFTYGADLEPLGPTNTTKVWLGADNLEQARLNFTHQKVRQALDMTGGNRTRAAQLLGITARTLFRYLEEQSMKELS